ncbi:MAG: class I SAM-dependent methyltransferase [Ilumatobacteraceae bacterium]
MTAARTARHTGSGIAAAYSAAGESWREGPTRIYDQLAREQLVVAQVSLDGASVLDLGAGTGAASRAAAAAGAEAITAVDVAAGMLRIGREQRPPAVIGDALALPFADGSFDVVIAAFSLNHLDAPADGLREAGRVTRHGGWVLASSYSEDDSHPVKQVVDEAAGRRGWRIAAWHEWLRNRAMPELATAERARSAALAAGLADVHAIERRVAFPDLGPREQVAWRLGMAQFADYLAGLEPASRRALEDEAIDALGSDPPVLERSVVFLAGRRAPLIRAGSSPSL